MQFPNTNGRTTIALLTAGSYIGEIEYLSFVKGEQKWL